VQVGHQPADWLGLHVWLLGVQNIHEAVPAAQRKWGGVRGNWRGSVPVTYVCMLHVCMCVCVCMWGGGERGLGLGLTWSVGALQ
jgi:hypothetical protein